MTTIAELAPSVGDRVEFLLEGTTYQADVLRHDKCDDGLPYLLGWKSGEKVPSNVGGRSTTTFPGYMYVWWCPAHIVVATPHPGGMTCVGRHCGVFNEYAVPNRPDNTYMCYQCRQRPEFMREPR